MSPFMEQAMDAKDIDRFERCEEQLDSLYDEVGLLSRKKPTDAVNEFKLDLINGAIAIANELLGDRYQPFDTFDSFDTDKCPTNSDVVLILAQYLRALDRLRRENTSRNTLGRWCWNGTNEKRRARKPRFFDA